jgi:hypothetical protein
MAEALRTRVPPLAAHVQVEMAKAYRQPPLPPSPLPKDVLVMELALVRQYEKVSRVHQSRSAVLGAAGLQFETTGRCRFP